MVSDWTDLCGWPAVCCVVSGRAGLCGVRLKRLVWCQVGQICVVGLLSVVWCQVGQHPAEWCPTGKISAVLIAVGNWLDGFMKAGQIPVLLYQDSKGLDKQDGKHSHFQLEAVSASLEPARLMCFGSCV